jgi:putative AlgH/UPF0301 family transcriptional regulator
MAAGTFTVAGQRVRTSSTRRYVIFLVYRKADGTEGVQIHRRTDSFGTALAVKANYGWSATRKLVIIDTATGDEIVG